MRIDTQIAAGEFYSAAFPQIRRRFRLFQINPTAVEVRYADGSSPVVVGLERVTLGTLKRALQHAVEENVLIDGDKLDLPDAMPVGAWF